MYNFTSSVFYVVVASSNWLDCHLKSKNYCYCVILNFQNCDDNILVNNKSQVISDCMSVTYRSSESQVLDHLDHSEDHRA